MKIIVQFVIARSVAASGGKAHLLVDSLNVVQNFLSSGLRDPDGGELFQSDQDFHRFTDFGGARIGYHGTDMRHQSNESLSLQRLQGFAQLRSRNAELLAEQGL